MNVQQLYKRKWDLLVSTSVSVFMNKDTLWSGLLVTYTTWREYASRISNHLRHFHHAWKYQDAEEENFF